MAHFREEFLEIAKEVWPDFVVDKENRKLVNALIWYFTDDKRFETEFPSKNFHLGKCICIHGTNGTGKSMIMRIMQKFAAKYNPAKGFGVMENRMLCKNYQEQIEVDFKVRKNLFIDEFGLITPDDPRERLVVFGNKIVLGDEIIAFRHEMFELGYQTHLTTNLTDEQLKYFYTSRTYSRMKQMYNFIPLEGTDRRETARPHVKTVEGYVAPPVDKVAVEREWWAMVKKQFDNYKASGQMDVIGILRQIQTMQAKGLEIVTDANREQYLERAKNIVTARKEQGSVTIKPTEQREYRRTVLLAKAIKDNALNTEHKSQLLSIAMNMALQDFYDKHTPESFQAVYDNIITNLTTKELPV